MVDVRGGQVDPVVGLHAGHARGHAGHARHAVHTAHVLARHARHGGHLVVVAGHRRAEVPHTHSHTPPPVQT